MKGFAMILSHYFECKWGFGVLGFWGFGVVILTYHSFFFDGLVRGLFLPFLHFMLIWRRDLNGVSCNSVHIL